MRVKDKMAAAAADVSMTWSALLFSSSLGHAGLLVLKHPTVNRVRQF
jgi:hypothetical protein